MLTFPLVSASLQKVAALWVVDGHVVNMSLRHLALRAAQVLARPGRNVAAPPLAGLLRLLLRRTVADEQVRAARGHMARRVGVDRQVADLLAWPRGGSRDPEQFTGRRAHPVALLEVLRGAGRGDLVTGPHLLDRLARTVRHQHRGAGGEAVGRTAVVTLGRLLRIFPQRVDQRGGLVVRVGVQGEA